MTLSDGQFGRIRGASSVTKTLLCSLLAAHFIWPLTADAATQLTTSRFTGSGALSATPGRSNERYSVGPPSAPASTKQAEPATHSSPETGARFVISAGLHIPGKALAVGVPCAVNDLFKNGFE